MASLRLLRPTVLVARQFTLQIECSFHSTNQSCWLARLYRTQSRKTKTHTQKVVDSFEQKIKRSQKLKVDTEVAVCLALLFWC